MKKLATEKVTVFQEEVSMGRSVQAEPAPEGSPEATVGAHQAGVALGLAQEVTRQGARLE